MSNKVHMQDQAFNTVAQIMNHNPKLPVHITLAGIRITLQFSAPKSQRQQRTLQQDSWAH